MLEKERKNWKKYNNSSSVGPTGDSHSPKRDSREKKENDLSKLKDLLRLKMRQNEELQ